MKIAPFSLKNNKENKENENINFKEANQNKCRVAVFASYDKDNIIQDYVVYYLSELKKVSEKIIFVADCNYSVDELGKIKHLANEIISKRHGEYDFGSYKRGFFKAKELGWLENCDELILCNDSCYGPIYDLKNIFYNMSLHKKDFWGITMNPKGFAGGGTLIVK